MGSSQLILSCSTQIDLLGDNISAMTNNSCTREKPLDIMFYSREIELVSW